MKVLECILEEFLKESPEDFWSNSYINSLQNFAQEISEHLQPIPEEF